MYNGKTAMNLLCAVDVENYGHLLPDMKIKDETLKFLSSQNPNEPFFLGVGFHKPHVPFHIPRKVTWFRLLHYFHSYKVSKNECCSLSN